METKEYFEKVMQNYNQNRKDRNLRSIVQMKALITSCWLSIKEIMVSYDGKLLRPWFDENRSCHRITREQVILLISNSVQSKMYIYDNEPDESGTPFELG